MMRNWTVFKDLWGLPADAPLERGYEIRPSALAPPARYVPLPALGASHESEDGRVYREDSQRVALKHGVAAVSANEATALRDAFAEAARWSDVAPPLPHAPPAGAGRVRQRHARPGHARRRRRRPGRRARGQPA